MRLIDEVEVGGGVTVGVYSEPDDLGNSVSLKMDMVADGQPLFSSLARIDIRDLERMVAKARRTINERNEAM